MHIDLLDMRGRWNCLGKNLSVVLLQECTQGGGKRGLLGVTATTKLKFKNVEFVHMMI
jgi:hypothetical protein